MQQLDNKITGSNLTAGEWNQVPGELQNVITGAGITLDGNDVNQLGKAVAQYVATVDYYTDSGVADAYVLSPIGSNHGPVAYSDGMRVRFIPANDNTGASTVNVNSLGVKNIKTHLGNTLSNKHLRAGRLVELVYNATADEFRISETSSIDDFGNGRVISITGNNEVGIQGVAAGFIGLTVTGSDGAYAHKVLGASTSGQSRGLLVTAGVAASDIAQRIERIDGATLFEIAGDGKFTFGSGTIAAFQDATLSGNNTVLFNFHRTSTTALTTIQITNDTTGRANQGDGWTAGLDSATDGFVVLSVNNRLKLGQSNNYRVSIGSVDMSPEVDNTMSCGSASLRWTDIYAVSGSVNTSDEREKTIDPTYDLGIDFIRLLNPIKYKWNVRAREVVSTGDEGWQYEVTDLPGVRYHYGLSAQNVKAALEQLNLNPSDIGIWALDDPNDPNSTQSLRPTELIAPIIAAIKDLDTRLTNAGF